MVLRPFILDSIWEVTRGGCKWEEDEEDGESEHGEEILPVYCHVVLGSRYKYQDINEQRENGKKKERKQIQLVIRIFFGE